MRKGQKLSDRHRKILIKSNLGKKRSEKTKKKISNALIGRIQTEEHKRKIGLGNKGKIRSEEFIRKMQENKKGKRPYIITDKIREKMSESAKGKQLSNETRKRISEGISGEKHYNWKSGITPENHRIRRSIEYSLWREANFARDNWTCQKCKVKGDKLIAHHIQNFGQYPELRFAIDNGITLCHSCHKKFHKIYGHKNNTKEQLWIFLS